MNVTTRIKATFEANKLTLEMRARLEQQENERRKKEEKARLEVEAAKVEELINSLVLLSELELGEDSLLVNELKKRITAIRIVRSDK
jgi:DNA-binding protein H-NS